ncbi:hypothetical protein BX600DRAFT_436916 [Xylariales sp. PMI_506]|nr:hypothetical protein BX600DRAFT_436916 [Xylariales sp. PMI_506]
MTSDSVTTATLAVDITLSLPCLYVMIKHGFHHGAIVGWLYLFLFFGLKIVGSIMEMHDPTSSAASLIASIGLSPLILAALGILHEARAYCIANRNRFFDLVWIVGLHFFVSGAVVLVAMGASGAQNPDTSPDKVTRDLKLVKIGMAILIIGWLALIILTLGSLVGAHNRDSRRLGTHYNGKWLLIAVALSIPFIGVRLITSLVYFTGHNPDLNPVTGTLAVRVGLIFIEEFTITVAFVVAGIMSRNVRHDEQPMPIPQQQYPPEMTYPYPYRR